MSFEELGPTFVKFGQLLASRPDLVPKEFVQEFKKLHDQVTCIEFPAIKKVLEGHFGKNLEEIFKSIDQIPLAAASMAQVYRAELKDGQRVVVKVLRPGIEETIHEDLGVIYQVSELLDQYVPETRIFNPKGLVNEFFKTLELEINFNVEANNMRRFESNFRQFPHLRIPHVYMNYSGRRVLVMEELDGVPFSRAHMQDRPDFDPEAVIRTGLRAYVQMVFRDGLFHADLHAGNLFILPNNEIGLVDFGVVGRLNRRTQDAIARMFVALAHENYDRLANEFVDLSPYDERTDPNVLARELRDLIAPYFGLTMKNVNTGRILLDSAALAARHYVMLPSELMLFFKSLLTIEGMGRLIIEDFDFLSFAFEIASDVASAQYEPSRIKQEIQELVMDSTSLLYIFPRQFKTLLRRFASPNYAIRLNIQQIDDLKQSIEASANLLFLGLIIGSLILSATLALHAPTDTSFAGLPLASALGYGFAFLVSVVAFFNYIRK